ncbi:MAG: acetate kinase [Elusimicrobia bacterium CG_4_10_14_3_um_filter_49_12_50_7]|nr:MAG: acetate kinase [Elusimicrobia bacterium CG_4_10_14_3_um_filter_49_12_50_7]
MKILVINCRIYSAEYELIDMPSEEVLGRGKIEKIGLKTSSITFRHGRKKEKFIEPIMEHAGAVHRIIELLTDAEFGVIKDTKEIKAVGHRIVHGGNKFYESVIVTDKVLEDITKLISLAPLHNPYNLSGIEAIKNLLPGVKQAAVFGTAFFRKMPEHAHYYALPRRLIYQYDIKRYGFHGISHQHCLEQTAALMKKPSAKLTMISCHLGWGASITAIKNGVPVDTSMGFSPVGGLMMATRCGNIDPGVIVHLMRKGWTLNEVNTCLNRESGLLGVSGISDDMREVLEAAEKGDKNAAEAVDMFCYLIVKYIGAYHTVLGGADAISFTAGIGVNSPVIRNKICESLKVLGVKLDAAKNKKAVGQAAKISSAKSKIAVFTIPRNEVLLIARETARLLG